MKITSLEQDYEVSFHSLTWQTSSLTSQILEFLEFPPISVLPILEWLEFKQINSKMLPQCEVLG